MSLKKHGIFADLMPSSYYAKDLAQALCQTMQKGQRVLLPRCKDRLEGFDRTSSPKTVSSLPMLFCTTLFIRSHNTHAVEKLIDDGQVSCAVIYQRFHGPQFALLPCREKI